ncbi:MAG: histidine phosphatase family protein [Oscillospiraceae bacterium]|jgi:probable phosphoglycerate mutase|nr:histidine phosphatase family protein [Oscillospiraceae bacterium]
MKTLSIRGEIVSVFYLVRHGETDYSQGKIAQGQTDVPLNAVGLATANSLGLFIANNLNIKFIFSSDLLRCRQTCSAIVEKIKYSINCETVSELREISLGVFEGRPIKELELSRKESNDYNAYVPEGGESFNRFTDRVMTWFRKEFASFENALIISHRGTISVITDRATNKNEFDIKELLKQGNIVVIEACSVDEYRISKIIKLGETI